MRSYSSKQRHAEFPLGGIGTGTITLKASGQLTDLQIFNKPDFGMPVPYTFFAMHAKWKDREVTRSLEAEDEQDFYRGRGYHASVVRGTPRFPDAEMTVRYPFATIRFLDETLPLRVTLTAFNPFIPSRADDSGIPGIVFRFTVENQADEDAEVLIVSSMQNLHNTRGVDVYDEVRCTRDGTNEIRELKQGKGVFMTGHDVDETSLYYANNSIAALDEYAETRPYWYKGQWFDGVTDFWNNLKTGKLIAEDEGNQYESAIGGYNGQIGSVGIRKTIPAGHKVQFTFLMTWYVPNRIHGWFASDADGRTMRNWYANIYKDSWDVAEDLSNRLKELEDGSRRFSDALYATTIPEAMQDAVASNIAVLRSTTCWRTPDGIFMGWEGSHEHAGSCHGTCLHVWNYAQTVASLFPELEKSSRLNEFLLETEENGKMNFRNQKKFGVPALDMYPAADGQFGTIIRAWREWTTTGDRTYLEKIYPSVLKAFDFAMEEWDKDGDGVPEARQHNTYDIEFFGPNPLSAVLELGAVRALQYMAMEMGDCIREKSVRELFEKARDRFRNLCWQGEYYHQSNERIDQYPYQFGEGCLSDQLFGQTMAYLSGLGALLPEDEIQSAARAVFRYNFLSGDRRDSCLQRLFVARDEPGLVLCSWPNGGKPRFPFVYSDEVWSGIEYQVATLLIYSGMENEAIQLVEAVRSRYDGERRSPWNEMECGSYYTRAMASWGLLIAESGFVCNKAHGELAFSPVHRKGKWFWSLQGCWGTFSASERGYELIPLYGRFVLEKLSLPFSAAVRSVTLNNMDIDFACQDNALIFNGLEIHADDQLILSGRFHIAED